jgi:toxin ParE1/3/4
MPPSRKRTIRYEDDARADLRAIRIYIRMHNPAAAKKTIKKIRTTFEAFATHPDSGRPGRVAGTREAVLTSTYIAVYTVEPTTISVRRVLHSAQQWP